MKSSKPICIIPARMASSRFPGKSLAPLLGLPLVLHVYERSKLYSQFSDVVVATCDLEIERAVIDHGGTAVMTSDTHERCTDRVEECIQTHLPEIDDDRIIVMVQGDEVLVTPELIEMVVKTQIEHGAEVVNLGSRLYQKSDQESKNTVKIVANKDSEALYMSRSIIPSDTRDLTLPVYQQTGIMAFTWRFLKLFSSLPQSPLEKAESVDMLRVIENNIPLHVVFTETETLGVDTPSDLENGEQLLQSDPTTRHYMEVPA